MQPAEDTEASIKQKRNRKHNLAGVRALTLGGTYVLFILMARDRLELDQRRGWSRHPRPPRSPLLGRFSTNGTSKVRLESI